MKRSRKKSLAEKLQPLGWWLIERKLFYYYPDLVHKDWWKELTVPDDIYDEVERNYIKYVFALKLQNFNVHKTYYQWQDDEFQRHAMFEVDFTRPSVQLVCSKLGKPKMTNAEEAEEQELRATKYPKFSVLTGGKGPPDEPSDDWLSVYEVGTTFVSMKKNSQDCDYELFYVLFKSLPDVILLKWQLYDGKVLDKYVEPRVFSKLFKPGVILGITRPSEEDTEDGNCNRPDRPTNMVLHEAVSGDDSVSQDEERP